MLQKVFKSKSLLQLLLIAFLFSIPFSKADPSDPLNPRKFVIITDFEPDDRVSLHVFGRYAALNELGLVGSSLKNSEQKASLIRRTLHDLGFLNARVFRGQGGIAEDYPELNGTKLALSYGNEGVGILSPSQLKNLEEAPRDGTPFRQALRVYLENNTNVEVIVLAPPTDLVEVLAENPELVKNIKTIHLMGGWIETEGILRTTYNTNMDVDAMRGLLSFGKLVQIRVYSSHMLKKQFPGGSIRRDNMPSVLLAMETAKAALRSLVDFEKAGRLWDEALIEAIPALAEKIGLENMGRQFTPADPALMLSVFQAKRLEKKVRKVQIEIDQNDLDLKTGYRVVVKDDSNSKIEVIEEVDVKVFEELMTEVFEKLTRTVNTRLRRYSRTQVPIDWQTFGNEIKKLPEEAKYAQQIGRDIRYIRDRLSKLDPFKHSLIVNMMDGNALEFTRIARREGFQVIGIVKSRELPSIEDEMFSFYDRVYILEEKSGSIESRKTTPKPRRPDFSSINLDRPTPTEIYISFHTKDGQTLNAIEKALAEISNLHPNAVVVHGFLPRSQIHYLPEKFRDVVKSTLNLLDKYFAGRHIYYRNRYMGLGDVRREMAERAFRTHTDQEARLYVIGDINHGVKEEVILFSNAGVPVIHVPLDGQPLQSLRQPYSPEDPITCELTF